MDINDIPEPARSALFLIDAYGKVHPDNPFMTAIGGDNMLGGDPRDIVRRTDDNKGSFVMTGTSDCYRSQAAKVGPVAQVRSVGGTGHFPNRLGRID